MVESAAQRPSHHFPDAESDNGCRRGKNHQVPEEPEVLESEIAGVFAEQSIGHRIAAAEGTEAAPTARGAAARTKSARSTGPKTSGAALRPAATLRSEAWGRATRTTVAIAAWETIRTVGKLLPEFDLGFLPFPGTQGTIVILVEFLKKRRDKPGRGRG